MKKRRNSCSLLCIHNLIDCWTWQQQHVLVSSMSQLVAPPKWLKIEQQTGLLLATLWYTKSFDLAKRKQVLVHKPLYLVAVPSVNTDTKYEWNQKVNVPQSISIGLALTWVRYKVPLFFFDSTHFTQGRSQEKNSVVFLEENKKICF